jgi:hypothetical protein
MSRTTGRRPSTTSRASPSMARGSAGSTRPSRRSSSTRCPPAPRAWQLGERIHQLWGETWSPRLTLGMRVRRARTIERSLDENTRLLVNGAAGSGKTLLAREAALRRAADGERVLVLTFTEALAHWLGMKSMRRGSTSHPSAGSRSSCSDRSGSISRHLRTPRSGGSEPARGGRGASAHVVEGAPLAPFPRERAHGVRVPRSRLSRPEQELTRRTSTC